MSIFPRLLLLALFLILAIIALEAPVAKGALTWGAGHEAGDFSEWTADGLGAANVNTGTGVGAISPDRSHFGSLSLKMTISNVNGTSQAVRFFRWGASSPSPEAYYGAWYYFPARYSGMSWWNVFQFKSDNGVTNDPTATLNVGNLADGRMRIYLWDHLGKRGYDQYDVALPENRWVHLEVYMRKATTATGQITVYQDGVPILDANNIVTRRPNDDLYWGVSNYTDRINGGTATIYVDDATISTTRVGPGAVAPTPTAVPPTPTAVPPTPTAVPPTPTAVPPTPTVALPNGKPKKHYRVKDLDIVVMEDYTLKVSPVAPVVEELALP